MKLNITISSILLTTMAIYAGTAEGYIWNDTNGNSIRDKNEGVSGINLKLTSKEKASLKKFITTDNNGHFKFEGLNYKRHHKISILNSNVATDFLSASEIKDYDIELKSENKDVFILENGITESGSVEDEKKVHYKISALKGDTVTTTLNGLDADADLYVKIGKKVIHRSDVDCKSSNSKTKDESCSVILAKDSDVFIAVYGYNATDFNIKAEVKSNSSKQNSVGNFIWEDSNKNGIQDKGERGIDGIKVYLLTEDKKRLSTTTTTNGGQYRFTNLSDGKYRIAVDTENYDTTKKRATKDMAKDSNAHGAGYTFSFKLSGNRYDDTIDIGLRKKESNPPASWCNDNKYVCVTNTKELERAIKKLQAHESIILKENIYNIHNLKITKPYVTIASQYALDGDKSHINKTILRDKNIIDTEGDKEFLIRGVEEGDSRYLSIIGLKIENVIKGIGFEKGYGLVANCNINTFDSKGSDAISFDHVTEGGGEVRNTTTYTKDEGVDIDLEKKHKDGSGIFHIHNNTFIGNSKKGDDLIEIRVQATTGKYKILIENNKFNNAKRNAIQIIDSKHNHTDTTIEIKNNQIQDSGISGIDTTDNGESNNDTLKEAKMKVKMLIFNNYFYNNNKSHIEGGKNMHIKNNIFVGEDNTDYALAWVDGDSTVDNNMFFENDKKYKDSKHDSNAKEADSMDDVKSFAKNNNIKLK